MKRWVWVQMDTPTKAEREILCLLADGLTYKEIAKKRGRAPRTVEKQIVKLMADTDQHNKVKLINYARAQNWLQPPDPKPPRYVP